MELPLPGSTVMNIAHPRKMLALVAAIASVIALPAAASAQAKIYPPGTDCANQPTIAGRLLCGRQELRRQSGTAIEQPMEKPPEPRLESEPFPEQPGVRPNLLLAPEQQLQSPRTASPNH
jgi:hypothetical protein